MCALILRLFNICFPQLPIYITALLNHKSPIPNSKGAARDATLHNAGQILMQTDHRVSSMPYGRYWIMACEVNRICTQLEPSVYKGD